MNLAEEARDKAENDLIGIKATIYEMREKVEEQTDELTISKSMI